MLSQKVVLSHKVVLSRRVTMVSHKVVLSRKVVLSWQALFRVPQVVSRRTSGGCGRRRNLGTTTALRNRMSWKSKARQKGLTTQRSFRDYMVLVGLGLISQLKDILLC